MFSWATYRCCVCERMTDIANEQEPIFTTYHLFSHHMGVIIRVMTFISLPMVFYIVAYNIMWLAVWQLSFSYSLSLVSVFPVLFSSPPPPHQFIFCVPSAWCLPTTPFSFLSSTFPHTAFICPFLSPCHYPFSFTSSTTTTLTFIHHHLP